MFICALLLLLSLLFVKPPSQVEVVVVILLPLPQSLLLLYKLNYIHTHANKTTFEIWLDFPRLERERERKKEIKVIQRSPLQTEV